MLNEDELKRIGKHGAIHRMGMCGCPCFDALVEIGKKLAVENELRVKLAKANPDVLAALTIGAADTEGATR